MLNGNLNKLPEITQYRSERMVFDLDNIDLSETGATVFGYFNIKKQMNMKPRFELKFEVKDSQILRY